MAIAPTFRRTPLKSMLDFAADREREANSIGDVITQLTQPILGGMGVQTGGMAPTPVDFNPRSTELLGAADPRLRDILTETERRARERGIEIQVSETLRDPQRQAALVEQGKSQTMNSRHLTGNAADIYIQNPDGSANWDFEAYRPVADIAKQVAAEKGYDDLVWGGDWQTLKDGVHFQLGGATTSGGDGTTSLMGGAGGDTLGGGMNVEDILARLYPEEAPEDARVQRRRDILAGVSQVFGALDQGGVPDVSNIRAQQEQRKRQAVLDMRERERARAAASLVYSQTGDANLATGIATGAISYSDVLSERQLRRAQELADEQKIREAESAQAVADAMKGTGLFKDEDIANVAAGKLDPNTLFGIYEKAQVAEKLAEDDLNKAEIAAQNVIDAQTILSTAAPGSVEARAAERVIALGGSENVYDIIKARTPASADTKVLGPNERLVSGTGEIIATGITPAQDDKVFQFQAEIDARVRYLGEDLATAANVVLNKPDAAGYGVSVSPSGVITVTPPSAPAAVTPLGAPAAPAAPATPAGVAGAFGQQMDTGLIGAPAAAPTAAPVLPLDVATDVADLETKLFDLQQARDAAPDEAARRDLDLQIGEVEFQQAKLALQEARSAQGLDEEEQRLRIQEAEQRVATAKAERDQKEREAAALKESEEEKAARKKYEEAVAADTIILSGNSALDKFVRRLQSEETGPLYGMLSFAQKYVPRTESYNLANDIQAMKDAIALDRLQVLKENSPTGASALGPATDKDAEMLKNALGVLDPDGDPAVEIPKMKRAINLYMDKVHGSVEFIQQQYEEGKLTAEEAAQFSRRYDVNTLDVALPDPALGKVTSLQQEGGAGQRVAKDSPDPEFEMRLRSDPTLIEKMTFDDYNALSPAQKLVFDRLSEGAPQ